MFLENEETRKIKPIKLSNKTITKKPKEEDYNELEFNNLCVTEVKPWANQNEDDFNFINFESTNDINSFLLFLFLFIFSLSSLLYLFSKAFSILSILCFSGFFLKSN